MYGNHSVPGDLSRLSGVDSGSQPGVHGPLSGLHNISGSPQYSKCCVTVNRRGSAEYKKIAIGGPQPKKVETTTIGTRYFVPISQCPN